jgi:hypothetical protein
MNIEKILYQNKKYNIHTIENTMNYNLPALIHTAYYDNMVVMPKCKCHVFLESTHIESLLNIIETTGYIAFVREHYKSSNVKRGCVGRILEYTVEKEEGNEEGKEKTYIKLYVEGIKRFVSYQDAKIRGYPHEVIKPDFRLFEKDDTQIPIPINFETLDSIFLQFFLQFIGDLNIDSKVDFGYLSLDKFLNSLIMIMPISDTERFYLSELASLSKRQEALSLILNCTFNGLTSEHKYH